MTATDRNRRGDPGQEREFAALLEYVERELGFATSYYNDAYLGRRLAARMRRTRTDSYGEYHRLLEDDPDEQIALLDCLSVNVTSFFRNPEVWDGVRGVLRDLTSERRRVRCWSAPCSDGREPYSMAMLALDDPDIDARRIEITGIDIDDGVLATAREGVYETTRTTDIDAELAPIDDYSRLVDHAEGRFRVRDRVKDLVAFEHHDLVTDRPRHDFDLVMCRNLFIYIDAAHKRAVMDTLTAAIRDEGYLAIGMTETLPDESRAAFAPVDKRHRIYRKRA